MKKNTHFIANQGWSLLADFENPKKWIDQLTIRQRANLPTGLDHQDVEADPWVMIDDHYDFLRNHVQLSGLGDVDLSRFVFTSDSGAGKSIAIDWITAGLNHAALTRRRLVKDLTPDETTFDETAGWLAFNIPRSVLTDHAASKVSDELFSFMAAEIKNKVAESGCTQEVAESIIERHRRGGRLVLLFDGLDHLSNADGLKSILNSTRWKDCSIGLGGRPYSINRYWEQLFAGESRWRFVRVEPFTEEQQKEFLTPEKWKQVPEEARHLLSIPRVIRYVDELDESRLSSLKTPSDVFYGAIETMIKQGLKDSDAAGQVTGEKNLNVGASEGAINATFHLLSAIAFEMVSQQKQTAIKDTDGEITGYTTRPNFDRVEGRTEMDAFRKKVQQLTRYDQFDTRWIGLSALNNGLLNSFFDDETEGLKLVQFSNRGLQEFLCAFYLANYCGTDERGNIAEGANDFLWDWIYLPFEPETQDYYDIWLYLTEMPQDARRDKVWLESIAPLYSRARRDGDKWVTKRSNEMIFRSWQRLERAMESEPRAFAIREHWWSEFESEVQSGNRGKEQQRLAADFVGSFVDIPGDTFTMGTTADKQGQLANEKFWTNWVEGIPVTGESDAVDAHIELVIERVPFPVGAQGNKERDSWRNFLSGAIASGSAMAAIRIQLARTNEHEHEVPVQSFALSESPCLNGWFRLYDFQHGDQSLLESEYQRYSNSNEHPVIYVSWFDAFVAAKWFRWQGQSCRLPWEHEWEYACKLETPWHQRYWWGDDFDPDRANAENNVGAMTPPFEFEKHVNKAGLIDLSGNVLEWCQDNYRELHELAPKDNPGLTTWSRVLRGGSFNYCADGCRSSYRYYRWPGGAGHFVGVRFSRARKS